MHLEANGLHFHALAAGPADGPLVLLLHGFPETAWSWRRQVAALAAEGLRVVAPDQRGYGLSDKPAATRAYAIGTLAQDVVGMALALGRSRFSVVGHDWGGAVAWFLAAHRQDVCSRAAILNAPHPAAFASALRRHPTQLGRSAYMALFQVPALPEWLLSAGDFRLLERSLRRTSREDAFTPEDIDALRAAWRQPGALTGMLAWYRALRFAPHDDAHAAGGAHPRIEIPVRVLWGDRDAFLEPALAQASITQCARGEVFHLPTATHWLHHEEPRRVNALLKAFLQ